MKAGRPLGTVAATFHADGDGSYRITFRLPRLRGAAVSLVLDDRQPDWDVPLFYSKNWGVPALLWPKSLGIGLNAPAGMRVLFAAPVVDVPRWTWLRQAAI